MNRPTAGSLLPHARTAAVAALVIPWSLAGCRGTPHPRVEHTPAPRAETRQDHPSTAPTPSTPPPAIDATASAATPSRSVPEPLPTPIVELAPGLRLDRARRRVEFDGVVPIDAHDAKTAVVFLEWLVCGPDTKEHESLVLTRVKPSLIHAALLALDLEPGSPGSWDWTGRTLVAIRPTGACLRVLVRAQNTPEADIRTWVSNQRTGQPLASTKGSESNTAGFVFAGSHIVERRGEQWYQADREGGVVGLACFSTELVAWTQMFNPDTGVESPVWIANAKTVPPVGTDVTVILEACSTIE